MKKLLLLLPLLSVLSLLCLSNCSKDKDVPTGEDVPSGGSGDDDLTTGVYDKNNVLLGQLDHEDQTNIVIKTSEGYLITLNSTTGKQVYTGVIVDLHTKTQDSLDDAVYPSINTGMAKMAFAIKGGDVSKLTWFCHAGGDPIDHDDIVEYWEVDSNGVFIHRRSLISTESKKGLALAPCTDLGLPAPDDIEGPLKIIE